MFVRLYLFFEVRFSFSAFYFDFQNLPFIIGKNDFMTREPACGVAPNRSENGKSKIIDMAIAATVAGGFFLIYTKLASCQQRLTEVEKELDDFKLTSSLQHLTGLKAVERPIEEERVEEEEERIVESSPPPPRPLDAVQELDEDGEKGSEDENEEEEEEDTPPPPPTRTTKRRSK